MNTLTAVSPVLSERGTAWAALCDVRRWSTWLPTVTSVTALDPTAEEGVGAAYRVVQPRLGEATWTITEWEQGTRFTWQSRRPGVTTIGTHELVETADGTRARLGITWVGPLAWFARRAFGRMTQGYLDQEAAALADRCRAHP